MVHVYELGPPYLAMWVLVQSEQTECCSFHPVCYALHGSDQSTFVQLDPFQGRVIVTRTILADSLSTLPAGVGGGRFQSHCHPASNPGSAPRDCDRETSVAGENHTIVAL